MLREIFGQCVGYTLLAGFILGLFLVVTVPFEMYQMAAASNWPSRKGIITKSSAALKISWLQNHYWQAEICGVYKEVGVGFCVSRVRYGEFRFGDGRRSTVEAVAKYPVGSEIDVYYSPIEPGRTILEPHASRSSIAFAFGLGAGLLLLPALIFVSDRALAP